MTDARTEEIIARALGAWMARGTAASAAAFILASLQEEGKVIVPRKPTRKMERAGDEAMPVIMRYWMEGHTLHAEPVRRGADLWVGCEEVWNAMLLQAEKGDAT